MRHDGCRDLHLLHFANMYSFYLTWSDEEETLFYGTMETTTLGVVFFLVEKVACRFVSEPSCYSSFSCDVIIFQITKLAEVLGLSDIRAIKNLTFYDV